MSSARFWALLVDTYRPGIECTVLPCQICFTSKPDVAYNWCCSLTCDECMAQISNRNMPCPNQSNLCWETNANGSWKMRDERTHVYKPCEPMFSISDANRTAIANRILREYALKTTLPQFNDLVEYATPFITPQNRTLFPNDLHEVSPTQLLALATLASQTFPAAGMNSAMIADATDEWMSEYRKHLHEGGPSPLDASLGFKPPVPYVAPGVMPPQAPLILPAPVQQRRMHAGHILKQTIPNTFGAAHGYPGENLNPAYAGYKMLAQGAPDFPTYQPPVGEDPPWPDCFYMQREAASKEIRRYWLDHGGAPAMPVHYNLKGRGAGCRKPHIFKDDGSPGYAADWVKMDACRMYWRGLITAHQRRIKENANTKAKATKILQNI